MKTLYKHVHLVIDDKREYLDGSILINNRNIEDVYINSNIEIDSTDVKVIELNNKIFIPSFFDSKSTNEKQEGVFKKFIYSKEIIDKPTHLMIEEDQNIELKNVYAISRKNAYKKMKGIKTLINPNEDVNVFADGVSDITELSQISIKKDNMFMYSLSGNCFTEFGIDDNISDTYIQFMLRNISTKNIALVSYNHIPIIQQIERLNRLHFSLTDIVAMSSLNALRFYGLDKLDGSLMKGKNANIICLDSRFKIDFVINEGVQIC